MGEELGDGLDMWKPEMLLKVQVRMSSRHLDLLSLETGVRAASLVWQLSPFR